MLFGSCDVHCAGTLTEKDMRVTSTLLVKISNETKQSIFGMMPQWQRRRKCVLDFWRPAFGRLMQFIFRNKHAAAMHRLWRNLMVDIMVYIVGFIIQSMPCSVPVREVQLSSA